MKYLIYIIILSLAMGCRNGNSNCNCNSNAPSTASLGVKPSIDAHDHEHEHDHEHQHDEDEIHFPPEKAQAVGLQTITVEPSSFRSVLKVGGQICIPEAGEATITAPENGIVNITKRSISAGIRVSAGETVFSVSASTMHEVAPLVQAKSEYEAALKAFNRAESLVKDRIISMSEFEQIALRYETAKTLYETHTANLTATGVQIKSPLNGYIKSLSVAQGEYVVAGQTLAVIAQSRRLQLRAEAPETAYKALKRISDANFRLAYDDKVYKLSEMNGRLIAAGQTASDGTFYIPVTFEFDNVGDILPGAFAEVFLLTTPNENVITAPLSAITEEQGLYFVYVQLDEEGYRKQEVTLGMNDGERVEVLTGLQTGDKLVVKSVYQLKLAANAGAIPEGHSHNH
jgi:RND family efflux transporter MFP subunit